MVHKILVEFKIELANSKKYSEHVRFNEVVRGEVFTVALTLKNIANEMFPGAVVKYMRIRFGAPPLTTDQTAMAEHRVPALEPNAQYELKQVFIATLSGGGWLYFQLQASDSQAIEYYQSPQAKPKQDEWIYPLYSIERETLDILLQLEHLVKQGEKK